MNLQCVTRLPHPGGATFHILSCGSLVLGSPRLTTRIGVRISQFEAFPTTVLLRKCRMSACVCGSSNGYELRSFIDDKEVDFYVERICEAIGVDEVWSEKEVTVLGRQTLLAMEGSWIIKWQNGGSRFREQFNGVEISLEWGCDGESEPWAVDVAGRCSILELDDREVHLCDLQRSPRPVSLPYSLTHRVRVCLLASWIRTGFWLTTEGRKQLQFSLVREGVAGVDRASSEEFTLSVQLKDGKVVAYVVVDVTTMYPLRADIRAFGGWNKWQFSDWNYLVAGQRRLFPFSSIHTQGSGNMEVYLVRECLVESDDAVESRDLLPFSYSSPILPIVSRPQKNYPRADIDSTSLPGVQMLRADSGHYLVQPLVNGKTIGYFIVDTGASTLIIAPQKARELGLSTFGEVHITGVNSLIKSQYCRANTFQLGQLRISNPVFMELPVSELVGGDPFVIGMCGFDIFAYCIVEMAYDEGRLSLFDPTIYRLLHSESLEWHTLQLLESVPHVLATFNSRTALFMLDTGAGGVDVIFHGRAVKKFDVLSCVQAETYAQLMGINALGKGLEVTLGVLDELTVGGRTFKQVKAMLARESAGNLDTSEYVAGLLCGDLLSKCRVVFDYGQRRFAITWPRQE